MVPSFPSPASELPARAFSLSESRRRVVVVWLLVVLALIVGMVALGGATRLTGSGLSMVEWRPLMGILPPTSELEWTRVFELYQRSPQFREVNPWMDARTFREIFWLEYLHRVLGRGIGVAVIVPWVWFVARGWLDRRLAFRTGMLLVLGAAQAGVGWFMVRSGLVDVPEVSHFRLAAHLLLAFFVAMWVLWTILDLVGPLTRERIPPGTRGLIGGLIALVLLQCVFGAFMAGTRAGWLCSSFPDMNGTLSPTPFFTRASLLSNLLENPIAIHWTHRMLAWVTLGYVALTTRAIVVRRPPTPLRRTAWLLLGVAGAQLALGAATVVFGMPVGIATAHQLGGLVLLAVALTLGWLVSAGVRAPLPRGRA